MDCPAGARGEGTSVIEFTVLQDDTLPLQLQLLDYQFVWRSRWPGSGMVEAGSVCYCIIYDTFQCIIYQIYMYVGYLDFCTGRPAGFVYICMVVFISRSIFYAG